MTEKELPKHLRSPVNFSGAADFQPAVSSIPTNVTPGQQKQHHRMTLLSWNAGGLKQSDWDNLQLWLSKQDIAVVMIQETKSTPAKSGGLLTLISKKLIAQQWISWQEILPGRLVHVRLHFSSKSIDLMHCYQHVWRQTNAEAREQFLQSLSSALTRVPRRNLLYILGDFNTTMPCSSDVVGFGSFMINNQIHTGSDHPDWKHLHDLCQTQGLVALNTFDMHLGATFVYP